MTYTKQQLNAGLQIMLAVSETIREAKEIPSGNLYAVLLGKVTLDGYNGILRNLKGAGLVSEDSSHMLRWVGPEVR